MRGEKDEVMREEKLWREEEETSRRGRDSIILLWEKRSYSQFSHRIDTIRWRLVAKPSFNQHIHTSDDICRLQE